MIATKIRVLLVPWHQLLQSIVKERQRQGIQPVGYSIYELLVDFEVMTGQVDLRLAEGMVTAWRQVRTVRGVLESLVGELLE